MSQPFLFLAHPVAHSHPALAEEQDPSRGGLLNRSSVFRRHYGYASRTPCFARLTAPGFNRLHWQVSGRYFCKILATGVTFELPNFGDAQMCIEIVVGIEHAPEESGGSVAGARATENWNMKVEGPNRFERSYTFSGTAGQHGPEAIRKMILQLIST